MRSRACQMAGCLLLFWAHLLPAEQIRVMQWNIKSSLGDITQNSSPAARAIARIVNYNQPDILLFCEVTNAVTATRAAAANTTALINWVTNNLAYLGSQPGVTFFVAVSSQTDGYIRNGAISRFPILNETTYDDGLRGLHAFQVQLATTNLQIYHAHLKASGGSAGSSNCTRKQSEAQFDSDMIKAFAGTNALPYIFGGDWNEDESDGNSECPIDSNYHPITTIRTNGALAEFLPTTLSGNHLTWSTATTPSIRFDYLLAATNRLSPVSGFVFSSMDWAEHGLYTNAGAQNLVNDTRTASDHFCVFADYAFLTPPPPPGLQLSDCWFSPGTGFQFIVANADRTPITEAELSRITIYSSADPSRALADWTAVTNSTLLTNGLLQVNDTNGDSYPQRFYRAMVTP